ncbi:alpha/beta fold hydrolase [Allonocardiopsis opalescens]|uniref:3-oxoadipate enol-lactonase n=1 Tax=Allonocardiopsis opalescens TaxID=1144618 RepID=A0A2T0PYG7_9ACTN|nr:alpha/beta fold hydrolase [Allonocardiopsis opalescens]PRX96558.1 3-oxoadipate enol-lactonase [Allonocardiopsis opalescens]
MTNGAMNVSLGHTGTPAAAPETIVFVNSLATTGRMWDGVVAELPPGHRVVRYDQRDRGGIHGRRPFELDDLVTDLFAVMDAANAPTAHVVGVSLGGIVGLRAAAREPRRVASLTAMCCAARFSRDVWVERGRVVRSAGFASIVPGIIDRWFTPEFQRRAPHVVSGFRTMLEATDPLGYAYASDLLASADVRDDLPSITAPTLVISGEADTANPVADQVMIAKAVPNARHATLPRTAHLAPAAEPARVARLIHNHITSALQR